MKIVLVGGKPASVIGLVEAGHHVVLFYELADRGLLDTVGDLLLGSCQVQSYADVDALASAMHHSGALQHGVDAITTIAEFGILPVALVATMFGLKSLDPVVAQRCRDKAVQKQCWDNHGVPTANFAVVTDRDATGLAAISNPCVAKPLSAASANGVAFLADDAERRGYLEDPGRQYPFLVEQWNSGREWHIDGVVFDGHLTDLFVSRYVSPLLAIKHGTPVASIGYRSDTHRALYDELTALTQRCLSSIGLTHAVFHLEVFGEVGCFSAGELAARPGGGKIVDTVRRATGIDLWATAAVVAAGTPVDGSRHHSGRTFGFTRLPAKSGIANKVASQTVADAAGVVESAVTVDVGAIMPDMTANTSNSIGWAIVEAATEEDCERDIRKLWTLIETLNSTESPER